MADTTKKTTVYIGDVVELAELLCQAILSTPKEGGKDGGVIQGTVGEERLGATIGPRLKDKSRCQWLRVCRSVREAIYFGVLVGQE